MEFIVLALSRNYRPEQEALEGSPIESETDPGLDRMIGDIRYLLAGSDLGLYGGVQYCDIQGNAKIVEHDLAQRTFTAEIPITVWASVHRADEDLFPLQEVWVQEQLVEMRNFAVFNHDTYLRKGYRVLYQGGLIGTPDPGVAYIEKLLVASAPGAHTFSPNTDTYRDLSIDGILRYTEVPAGDPAPDQPEKTLRIGFTRTDSSQIIDDYILSPSLEDYGDPFRIPKY
jgi:hypothetical protein